MKHILVCLSPEKHSSSFDLIVAHDSGADAVIPYSNVNIGDVKDIIYGCCFTRHPKDLKNTAVFIGGHDIEEAEAIADEAVDVLNELPGELKVSVALDPNGAYTTASACVRKIKSGMDLKNSRAVVLAGTGPVGLSTTRLLALEGAKVTLTSRKLEKAQEAVEKLKPYEVTPIQACNESEVKAVIDKADVVVAAGTPGIQLVSRDMWIKSNLKVLVDTSAVPPYGIEGIMPSDEKEIEGKNIFGAIAVGNLKMQIHRQMIKELFESNECLFNLEEIHKLE